MDDYDFSGEMINESLDSTELGRPLYESLGFNASAECMVLTRKKEEWYPWQMNYVGLSEK